MKYQRPRGTRDIIPTESSSWQFILDTCKHYLEASNYKQLITPIFESTDLFKRSVGESTDIVNKEMYTFLDRSDRSLTLRPEATAGVMRAFIENGLHREQKPIKLWTYGPMFRYERSQTGRYRQFHQMNAEVLGDDSIACEVESIFIIKNILNTLGIEHTIEINSLGDKESKENYKNYFKDFVKDSLDKTCDDCKRRYEQNPLRMLDCKVEADQKIYADAKKPIEFLSNESKERLDSIKSILKNSVEINPNLVRGLDYYNDFVFEVKATSEILKGQSTICGGGRYNNLVEHLGGSPISGYGFAIGIERLLLVTSRTPKKNISIMVASNQPEIFSLCSELSKEDLILDIAWQPKKIGKVIEQAVKKGHDYILFYLDNEKENGTIKIKDLHSRKESDCKVSAEEIIKVLKNE